MSKLGTRDRKRLIKSHTANEGCSLPQHEHWPLHIGPQGGKGNSCILGGTPSPLLPAQALNPGIILNHSFLLHVKKVEVAQSCPTLQPHGLYSPWNSLDQNSGVGRLSLLQGIFPTQGSNPDLPQWIPTILLPRCLLNPAPCFPTVSTVMLAGLFTISCLDHGPGSSLSSTSMLLLLLLLSHFSRVCLCATP